MYRKSAVNFERLHLQISSAGFIFNKTRSSLEANTVNMLVSLRSLLFVDIRVGKRLRYLLF